MTMSADSDQRRLEDTVRFADQTIARIVVRLADPILRHKGSSPAAALLAQVKALRSDTLDELKLLRRDTESVTR